MRRHAAIGVSAALGLGLACSGRAPAPAAPVARVTPVVAAPPTPAELVSAPAEYDIAHVSRDAGEAIFTRTGIGDPYRTGVPYPIWLALQRAFPDRFGATTAELAPKFGFVARPPVAGSADLDEREGLPIGMHLTIDPITGVPFVVTNCALCHAERLRWTGGEALVVGLGNKRVQIHAYDAAFADAARDPAFTAARLGALADAAAAERELPWPATYRDALVTATVEALRVRARDRRDYLSRTHAGPPGRVATIETFALALGLVLGRTVTTGRDVGWAKIPDVVGFGQRLTLSWDGVGEGSMDTLAVEADFAAGVRESWFWQHPLQGASLGAFLRQPAARPAFPGPIDRKRAAHGRVLFDNDCAPCHGHYAETGRSLDYSEQVIPIADVLTDPARAAGVTSSFVDAANAASHGITRTRATDGYVPPVLTNVWARGPYGHAGQWSSLAVMATPAEHRAAHFVIAPGALYDLVDVGIAAHPVVPGAALAPGEAIIDATQPGFGVGGHPFLADLGVRDAAAVIEYLKTL